MKKQAGFTLIELVIVIVILGILAATAVPKFVNLEKDARIAVLSAMESSLRSGAVMVHAKAVIQGVNVGAANQLVDMNDDGDTTDAGVDIRIDFGYPEDANNAFNIDNVMDDMGNFTAVTAGGMREFRLNGTNGCEVRYDAPAAAGAVPTYTIDSSAC